MTRADTLKRYIIFSIGVLVAATGIAFITRAGLGTSPISGVPFVLSLITPVSMGTYTFAFNMLFLVCEAVLVRKITVQQLLQIPATLLFSFCIDVALAIIPERFGGPWLDSAVYLGIGCLIMALGIYLEVLGGVIMLPNEAFVRALSKKLNKEFGNIKVINDTVLTLIALALALVFIGELQGVREGTLITALVIGHLVKFYGKLFGALKKKAA